MDNTFVTSSPVIVPNIAEETIASCIGSPRWSWYRKLDQRCVSRKGPKERIKDHIAKDPIDHDVHEVSRVMKTLVALWIAENIGSPPSMPSLVKRSDYPGR